MDTLDLFLVILHCLTSLNVLEKKKQDSYIVVLVAFIVNLCYTVHSITLYNFAEASIK